MPNLQALKSAGIAIGLLIVFSAGWMSNGWRLERNIADMKADIESANNEAESSARQAEQLNSDLSDAIAKAHALQSESRKATERVITKEVIKYVQSPAADKCALDPSGVRIHDQAATGHLSEDANTVTGANDSTEGVKGSQLIPVVVENYNACHEAMDRLRALQEWAGKIGG